LVNNSMDVHQNECEPWKVTLLETGLNTMTGGRIKQAKPYIDDDDFLLTYGDGLSDVDISSLVDFHKLHGKHITMTAVQPAGRYGALDIQDDNSIASFEEKPKGDGAWINGGFFVCKAAVLDYIDGDLITFEQEPLINLATEGQLMSFKHDGFWECMDTLRDKTHLNYLWNSNQVPWKSW